MKTIKLILQIIIIILFTHPNKWRKEFEKANEKKKGFLNGNPKLFCLPSPVEKGWG